MTKHKKHRESEDTYSSPSSPVCYSEIDGLRPGFDGETEPNSVNTQNSQYYSDPDSPEKIPFIFAEAWMKRDAKHLASLFEADAEFVNVVGLWWHKQTDIQKAHAYGLEVIFNKSKLEILRTKVKYLTDEIAVVHSKMKLTGQTSLDGKGDPKATRKTIFSFVVRRENNQWKCVSAHNTEIIPNAETFLGDSDGNLQSANYRK